MQNPVKHVYRTYDGFTVGDKVAYLIGVPAIWRRGRVNEIYWYEGGVTVFLEILKANDKRVHISTMVCRVVPDDEIEDATVVWEEYFSGLTTTRSMKLHRNGMTCYES